MKGCAMPATILKKKIRSIRQRITPPGGHLERKIPQKKNEPQSSICRLVDNLTMH
jgi:hypothetical protein